jgi:hypothetical protein
VVLTLFILSPLAVLTLLCVWMYFAMKEAPYMNAPARGAGAGRTGMANEHHGIGGERPAPGGAAAPAPKP